MGLGLAALVAFAASTYVTVAIFDKMPHIYDAQSYYFQAKLFAEGVFYVPTPPDRLAFDVPFTVWEAGKWFTMYTPGASLVLAIGMKLGAPWLVGPILAMGGVLLTYAAASRQFGGRTALLAAALMASSPFLHLQAGSFMSHVPGMFWGALVLYAAVRYVERRAIGWAMLGATALGCLFLTRELSAIVYGLTLGSYVLFRTGMAVWRSRQPPVALRGGRGGGGGLPGIGCAGGEHVPEGADDRVLDGAERAFVAAAGLEAPVLGGEVGVLGADRGQRGFLEREVQPLGALRVLPERRLPADWSLPGHWPAQDARCRGGREDASCRRRSRR